MAPAPAAAAARVAIAAATAAAIAERCHAGEDHRPSRAVPRRLPGHAAAVTGAGPGGDGLHRGQVRRRCRCSLTGCRDQCQTEEHTSELQSLMRLSYAVICLKKTNRP